MTIQIFFGHQNLVAINDTGCVSSCNCRFLRDWLPRQYPKASVGAPPKYVGSPWVAGQVARWVWGLLNLSPSSCVLWGIKQGGTRADRQTAPWTLCLVKSQGADPCGDTGTSPLLSAGLGGWLEPRCGKSPGGSPAKLPWDGAGAIGNRCHLSFGASPSPWTRWQMLGLRGGNPKPTRG